MSTLKQTLVEYANVISKSKGTSNTANMQKAFPNSPIHSGELTDEERLAYYQNLLDSESVTGYGAVGYSMNYDNGVPNLSEVETGGAGLPSSPYAPNPASPGQGSHSAATQPEFDGNIKNIDAINNFGTGIGGLASPDATSKNLSKTKIGEYVSGRSYQGSDGKV